MPPLALRSTLRAQLVNFAAGDANHFPMQNAWINAATEAQPNFQPPKIWMERKGGPSKGPDTYRQDFLGHRAAYNDITSPGQNGDDWIIRLSITAIYSIHSHNEEEDK